MPKGYQNTLDHLTPDELRQAAQWFGDLSGRASRPQTPYHRIYFSILRKLGVLDEYDNLSYHTQKGDKNPNR